MVAMLEGLRIADMTSVLFGPYCTQMLADLGADVVKIEPQNGDNGRTIGSPNKTPGMGAMHMNINRGKRSVSWDFKSERGREKLRKLIASSDVFIHNLRPSAILRLGFDYDKVKEFAPEIVYVSCTGFDSDGPDADVPAYDDIIQAGSGIASLLSRVDGHPEPRYLPTAVGDKVAGLYALQATLAALIHKLRTGKGQFVEVPMFEAVTAFTLVEHVGAAVFPDRPRKAGYARQVSAKRQPSKTADGYVSLAPYNEVRWRRLFDCIGRPDVFEDERLSTPELRLRNRDLYYEIIAEITPTKTTEEWLEIACKADVPAKRVNTLEELFDDPQLQAVKFFQVREHPTEGRYYEVRPPVKYSARANSDIGFAPHLGEHNAVLESELGLEDSSET